MADHISRDIGFMRGLQQKLNELQRKINDEELPFPIDGQERDELMAAIEKIKTLSIETKIALQDILKDENNF
jgi:hypothetical protein